MEKDGEKLWKLAKAMNDEKPSATPIILKDNKKKTLRTSKLQTISSAALQISATSESQKTKRERGVGRTETLQYKNKDTEVKKK